MDYSKELIKIAKTLISKIDIIKIQKKSIIVDALYFNGQNIDEVKKFCKDSFDEKTMNIKTLEGPYPLKKNCYILEGIKKENWCIDKSTLDKTYTIEKKTGNKLTLKTRSNKIEAVEFNGNNRKEIFDWMNIKDDDKKFIIKTGWGNLEVSNDDYVVHGVNGDYYPIKPDILKKTYDIL